MASRARFTTSSRSVSLSKVPAGTSGTAGLERGAGTAGGGMASASETGAAAGTDAPWLSGSGAGRGRAAAE
eukprot:11495200-Alexandrium_andersonii.AAC.1